MSNSNKHSSRSEHPSHAFHSIFIEKCAASHPMTDRILSHFPALPVQQIDNYRDVFYHEGNEGRALILAVRRAPFLFSGAPVCQDFNESWFTYASSAMNCLYDCDYCYLKGMYPSRDMVIFVNPEDTFAAIRDELKAHPLYVCISYDTDLAALEGLTGLVRAWADFARTEPELRIECRTKCARTDLWTELPPNGNFILAFTLSPEPVIRDCEHHTPSLDARLDAVNMALDAGHPVRLCFDPLIYTQNWTTVYGAMLDAVCDRVDLSRIRDISVGSFRISRDYLNRMRRRMPDTPVVQFPFALADGVYQYPTYLRDRMQQYLLDLLTATVPEEKIFLP